MPYVAVRNPDEFARAFTAMRQEHHEARIIITDPMHELHVGPIPVFAAERRLPVTANVKEIWL